MILEISNVDLRHFICVRVEALPSIRFVIGDRRLRGIRWRNGDKTVVCKFDRVPLAILDLIDDFELCILRGLPDILRCCMPYRIGPVFLSSHLYLLLQSHLQKVVLADELVLWGGNLRHANCFLVWVCLDKLSEGISFLQVRHKSHVLSCLNNGVAHVLLLWGLQLIEAKFNAMSWAIFLLILFCVKCHNIFILLFRLVSCWMLTLVSVFRLNLWVGFNWNVWAYKAVLLVLNWRQKILVLVKIRVIQLVFFLRCVILRKWFINVLHMGDFSQPTILSPIKWLRSCILLAYYSQDLLFWNSHPFPPSCVVSCRNMPSLIDVSHVCNLIRDCRPREDPLCRSLQGTHRNGPQIRGDGSWPCVAWDPWQNWGFHHIVIREWRCLFIFVVWVINCVDDLVSIFGILLSRLVTWSFQKLASWIEGLIEVFEMSLGLNPQVPGVIWMIHRIFVFNEICYLLSRNLFDPVVFASRRFLKTWFKLT